MSQGQTIGPGTELDGFVIESVAGRGGMGVVYRARQRQPERTVALKVIAADYAQDGAFRARFQREASIAAQIEHPNVIPVYAVGEAGGILYIAMRFVDGVDLRGLLASEGRLEPRRAAAIVDAVAEALDAAHAAGLVHRDVKPANILISATRGRDHVYLSDFGLSRHVEGSHGLTGTGAFLGTIDYVAPEQARGDRVDARTDVYSLGCVLFQALTGTVPFPLDNDLAKLYAHDTKPAPSVLERAPDLPATFDPVLARAMAKDPDDRYLSAGDLGRAAVAAGRNEPLSRAERSVAVGDAAPPGAETVMRPLAQPAVETDAGQTTARAAAAAGAPAAVADTAPSAPAPNRRPIIIVASALVAVVAAVGLIAALLGGGGSSKPRQVSGVVVGPAAQTAGKPLLVGVRRVNFPARGYSYRLALWTVQTPAGTAPSTPEPYSFVLAVSRGGGPFAIVEKRKLPFRFTASSVIKQFQFDPSRDGTGNVGLSWYLKNGETNDQTHYFTILPTGIQIDS